MRIGHFLDGSNAGIFAYGTPEGVKKEWDSRGRSGPRQSSFMEDNRMAGMHGVLRRAGFVKKGQHDKMPALVWKRNDPADDTVEHTVLTNGGGWMYKNSLGHKAYGDDKSDLAKTLNRRMEVESVR